MGDAWQNIVATLKGNRDVLFVLAGLFYFVPSLLWSLMAGPEPQPEAGASMREIIDQMTTYLRPVWPWLLLAVIASMLGSLAVWRFLLARGGTTTGGALGAAAALLPGYAIASILVGWAVGAGFILLVVPGLYLMARLCLAGPFIASHNSANPLGAIRESWTATSKNSWWILLFIIILSFVGAILGIIVQTIFGGLFALVLPETTADLLGNFVEAATGAALTLVVTVAYASIFRQLDPTT